MSFKTAAKVIAFFEMLGAALIGQAVVLLLGGYLTVLGLKFYGKSLDDDNKLNLENVDSDYHREDLTADTIAKGIAELPIEYVTIAFVVSFLALLIKFSLGLVLYRGAKKDDLKRCQIFFGFNLAFLIINVMYTLLCFGRFGAMFSIPYQVVCAWVVYGLIRNIRAQNGSYFQRSESKRAFVIADDMKI